MKLFVVLSFILSSLYSFEGSIDLHRKELVEAVRNGENFQRAMERYHQHLIEDIAMLIESAEQDLNLKGIFSPKGLEKAFFCFGSTGTGLTFPSSDLEFGVLVSRKTAEDMNYISCLVRTFYHLAKEEGLQFDTNGWVPQFIEKGKEYGRDYLIALPQALAEIRASCPNTTLSYALYKVRFLYGNRELFRDFEERSKLLRFESNEVITEEWIKTKKSLVQVNFLVRYLTKMIAKREGNPSYSQLAETDIELKFRILKPINELIQFLCMKEGIWESNPFSALIALEKEGILSPDVTEMLASIIENVSERYILQGDPISSALMDHREIQTVISDLQGLQLFYSICRKRL